MKQTRDRLQSVDALRGLDMCCIMGIPGIIYALYDTFGGNFLKSCWEQMEHVPWNGFHLMDMVFPLFLFIAGISFPFSLAKRRENGARDSSMYLHLIKRTCVLILLGFVYNGWLNLNVSSLRFASVLAHIGLAWYIASMLYMNINKKWMIGIVIAVTLLGYGLLNALVLAPDAVSTDPLLPENNIVAWFDRQFLPGVLYNGIFDPEGWLTLIPAATTALIGMLTGNYLRASKVNPSSKVFVLLLAGSILFVLALIADLVIPINKALWSSSFVLLTGGISIFLMASFYWLIDVCQFRRWVFFFRIIGLNSIFIYMAQQIIGFSSISSFFFSGLAHALPQVQSLIMSCGYVTVCWLLLYYLYRKNIFIKV